MSDRARRSALFMPASNGRAIAKTGALDCDVVILDLEDAVAPDEKAAARAAAIRAIRNGGFGTRELVVRVNAIDTEWGEADLAALADDAPDAVLVPKIDRAADIDRYRTRLDRPIWAMVETPHAVLHIAEIAAAGLAALVMGTNDLAKAMGATPDAMRTPFLGFLAATVAAARANGIIALDGVHNAIDDAEALAAECAQAAAFGFDGKSLIHPRQIAICNRAFAPSVEMLADARAIVAAFADPAAANRGAIRLHGRMVERLHLDAARRLLARA